MERPLKRPRLQIFGDVSSDAELDTARMHNDLTLKSRFESIFEKYSHDFSNIGDEVDLFTGDVVVNNGHIQSMESEIDTGIDNGTETSVYDGRALLLAMAAAPHDDDLVNPNADEVMQSIETIAGNAIQADDCSDGESEDDLFDISGSTVDTSAEPEDVDMEAQEAESFVKRYDDSDTDSLFEVRSIARSSSADSLFDQPNPSVTESRLEIPSDEQNLGQGDSVAANHMLTEEELLAKYRPVIRQELIEQLEERHEIAESQIEPAWRIPIQIMPPLSPVKETSTIDPIANSSRLQQSFNQTRIVRRKVANKSQHKRSLWKLPRPRHKNTADLAQENIRRTARDESEDPLQSGFSSERDETRTEGTSSDFETFLPRSNEAENDDLYAEDAERKQLISVCTTGVCPYCKVNYGNKSGVMAHWDRWLTKPARHKSSSDPHDITMMDTIRSSVVRRIRNPRLILSDFRTMVELHEGAGLSFEEIADSKTLWTRKTAFQLRDIFDKHRSIPLPNHSPPPSCKWTFEEEETLTALCQNDRVTLATMARKLPGKDEIDVGNRLAEIFLEELGRSSENPISDRHTSNSMPRDQSGIREVAVKVESEDELFQ